MRTRVLLAMCSLVLGNMGCGKGKRSDTIYVEPSPASTPPPVEPSDDNTEKPSTPSPPLPITDLAAFFSSYSGRWLSACVPNYVDTTSKRIGFDLSSSKIVTLEFSYFGSTQCLGNAQPSDGNPVEHQIRAAEIHKGWILLTSDHLYAIQVVDAQSVLYRVEKDGTPTIVTKQRG